MNMAISLEMPAHAEILHICRNLCDDQIQESIAQGWNESFDPEFVANHIHGFGGIKHVFRAKDGEPYCVAGYVPILPAVCESWMLATPKWMDHVMEVTRTSRRVMKHILMTTQFKRLQTVALASRTRAHEWYGTMGLKQEGVMRRMGRAGEDFIMFARVDQ